MTNFPTTYPAAPHDEPCTVLRRCVVCHRRADRAAGPVIIHLLNRRRYRVVQWAAMDFLREALQRNRRILTLRDLLLLLLRTAAVLLVGLALARPFFSSSDQAYDGSKPLHAVLVVDNSLSMGYESLEGTLLDQAKERAEDLSTSCPPTAG